MSEQPPTAAQEWRSHWPMVATAMLGMSFYSVITYSHGVFIEPLEREFGWKRAEISAGLSLYFLITMVGGPFVGAVIDRMGTRKLAIGGMAAASLGFAAFSLATDSLTTWFALWTVYAFCSLPIKSTIWSASVSSVFTTSRGLALAVALTGTAIGQALAPITAAWLIGDFGWREAFRWIGFGWGGLSFILLIFFFYDARDVDKRDAAKNPDASAKPAAAPLPGLTLHQALRDSRVLRIAAANLLLPLIAGGVTMHLVPIIAGTGLSMTEAAGIASLAGVSGIFGKIVTGWLLDRYQTNLIPVLSVGIGSIAHFLYLDLLDSTYAIVAAALIGGYAGGAVFQVTTYLISRYVGMKAFGTVFALIGSMMMVGSALGPTVAGFVYDTTGGYTALLLAAMPAALISAGLFIGLGPYPDFKAEEAAPPVGDLQPAPAE